MAESEITNKPNTQKKFYDHFQSEVSSLQQQIDRLASTSFAGGERVDATDHCLGGVARLSKEVNEASEHLPAHDRRTYADGVKALKTRLDEVRAATQPKPKFSFKSRQKNSSAISLSDAAELAQRSKLQVPQAGASGLSSTVQSSGVVSPKNESPTPDDLDEQHASAAGDEEQYPPLEDMRLSASIRKPSFSQGSSVMISNHSNVHIILPASASRATTSGALSKLRRCIVDMSDPTCHERPFAGLTIKNIQQSLIICGQVSGPIHMSGLEGTVVVASCRQFRMHDSKNCQTYLHCTSRPIIERCSNIDFAPLPSCYPAASDTGSENKWSSVDDFNWLRSGPRPNWQALPEEERIQEKVWIDRVPGGPNHGLEEILNEVGVAAPQQS